MHFTAATVVSLSCFWLILIVVLGAATAGVYFAHRKLVEPARPAALRFFIGAIVWLGITSFPVASGLLAAKPIPGVPLYFVAVNFAGLVFALSSFGKKIAIGLPIWALVAFQSFRLPLELVLHSWAEQGTIPGTMTWTGQNLDIISGIVACIAAPISVKYRQAAWVANAVGFALLLNVWRVALMSSPLPFAWKVEPPLQLVLYLPYAWIAPVCVAGALAGHVILTRALMMERRRWNRKKGAGRK